MNISHGSCQFLSEQQAKVRLVSLRGAGRGGAIERVGPSLQICVEELLVSWQMGRSSIRRHRQLQVLS